MPFLWRYICCVVFLCCLSSSGVLCARCCKFPWIVRLRLHLRCSLMFIWHRMDVMAIGYMIYYMVKLLIWCFLNSEHICFASKNRIGGVMDNVLASKCGRSWVRAPVGSNQRLKKWYVCFSANHAAWRRKSKDWLARNQNNVSEWSDMSTRGLLFHLASTIKIQLKVDLIIISLKIDLFSPWYSWNIAELQVRQEEDSQI